ncbi:MAG TPA: EutN/CcmL family microcompartment protein [Actinomycetospora sp.]|nr:EutN/CcmL family microcompartment protein [Actinomycetospora sp.]
MILGEVVGRVWSEREVDGLGGLRMVIVREPGSEQRHVAVDLLDAGTGTTVLLATDEAAAAVTGRSCVDAAVVALVAGWDQP